MDVLLRDQPLTCCSKLRMTLTAWCRMTSLVWGLSWLRCSWHILPSSLNASLMSRTLRRSRALLATRRSFSRSILTSGGRSSSSSNGLITDGDKVLKAQTAKIILQFLEICQQISANCFFTIGFSEQAKHLCCMDALQRHRWEDQNVCCRNNIQEAAYPTSCSLCLHLFGYYYFKVWFCVRCDFHLDCSQYSFSLRYTVN